MYEQAQIIEAKKQRRREELQNRETEKIEEVKRKKIDRLKQNKQKFGLSNKPIYKRTDGLLDVKS